jgi:hypothetical protein
VASLFFIFPGRERVETVGYPVFVCGSSITPDIMYCSFREFETRGSLFEGDIWMKCGRP